MRFNDNNNLDLICHTILFTLHFAKKEGPLNMRQLRAMVDGVLEATTTIDDETWVKCCNKGLIRDFKAE
jgi:hypothetical protein